jgi:hypothetical protein
MLSLLLLVVGCGDGDDVIDTDEECAAAGGEPIPRDGGSVCPRGYTYIGGATWRGEIEGVSCCRPDRR